jgi:hypothetical protein
MRGQQAACLPSVSELIVSGARMRFQQRCLYGTANVQLPFCNRYVFGYACMLPCMQRVPANGMAPCRPAAPAQPRPPTTAHPRAYRLPLMSPTQSC